MAHGRFIGLAVVVAIVGAHPVQAASCDGLTGQKRSKCLFDERRNDRGSEPGQRQQRPDGSAAQSPPSSPRLVEPRRASSSPSVVPSSAAIPHSSVWAPLMVSSPAGFPLYSQLNSGDSRLYSSGDWAEALDVEAKLARKKLTCLATVYTMIEHARGNSGYRVGAGTYSDSVGALGISGIGSSRALSSMDVVRAEFQSGNPVILWGPLARNPNDPFGHFILAVGIGSDGKIVAHDPYDGRRVTIDPVTRRVSGSNAINTVEKYRTVRL
jgi:Papain-like cysteine protease AvrRpt2